MNRDRRGRQAPPSRPPAARTAEITVETIAWGGNGLGRLDGKVVFVPKSAPGDRLRVRMTREKPDYCEGEIEKLLSPAPCRVSPVCPDFRRCGGCQLMHMNYPAQAEAKEKIAREVLRRWAGKAEFGPLEAMENPFGYRHSGDFHARAEEDGLKVGFYERESHRLIDFENCFLFGEEFNRALRLVAKLLGASSRKHSVKGLNLSVSGNGSDFVLTLDIAGGKSEAEELASSLAKAGLKGIIAVGKEGETLLSTGEPFISYSIARSEGTVPKEVNFKIDPRSFTQANFAMNSLLVRDAAAAAGLSRHESVLELFSGVGNFTIPLAAHCREVTAVESSAIASGDAKFNAEANGARNVRHLTGDALEQSVKLLAKSARFDAVLLDPPRIGAFELVSNIARFEPKRIVYVSCNLPTLERDLRRFYDNGYAPKAFRFYDLFPQTYGVETLALLEKA